MSAATPSSKEVQLTIHDGRPRRGRGHGPGETAARNRIGSLRRDAIAPSLLAMGEDAPIHVPLPGPLREARFIERPNRFLLRCSLSAGGGNTRASAAHAGVRENGPSLADRIVEVHLADPGRLRELLIPGKRVWIRHAASPGRKTDWSAVLVESPDGRSLVSLDTTLPNRLILRALQARALAELDAWSLERAEFPLGASRIDFLLTRGSDDSGAEHAAGDGDRSAAENPLPPRKLALEVKSVTLVQDGVALFPDAVTARGARHVRELAETARREGWEAAILFVLQRNDAHRIEAARTIDPDFADALAEARGAGVRVLGRRCRVRPDRLELGEAVPAD